MNKKIYLFRHGLTDWNKERKLQGHTNIPLNEEGIRQAESLVPFFKSNPVDLVFASPLGRAVETAKIATKNENPIQIKDLIEINLGEAEGVQEAELIKRFGEESLFRWRSFHPHDRDFAYPNAESKWDACLRFHRGITKIFTEHHFKSAAVCSHGFIMRRYFHSLFERKKGETYIPTVEEFPLIPNCKVYVLEFNGEEIDWTQGPL